MRRELKNLIYGLIDPRTLLIRYVGLTSTGMKRPESHSCTKGPLTNCKKWIKELQRLELDYEIAVLEVVSNAADLDKAERWWIAFGRACGWPLTNHTPGGSLSEVEREARRKQKQLVALRRAEECAVREWRRADEYETERMRKAFKLYDSLAKQSAVPVEVLKQDYLERTQWRREEVALRKEGLLVELKRKRVEILRGNM